MSSPYMRWLNRKKRKKKSKERKKRKKRKGDHLLRKMAFPRKEVGPSLGKVKGSTVNLSLQTGDTFVGQYGVPLLIHTVRTLSPPC